MTATNSRASSATVDVAPAASDDDFARRSTASPALAKDTILTIGAYFPPGYKSGGPARTLANTVDQLGGEFDFRVITADRDFMAAAPYTDVPIDTWTTRGNARVHYVSRQNQSLTHLSKLISETPHDVLYLNSFLHPVFTFLPLLARRLGLIPRRPTVLAPRGEFAPGALLSKRWKKAPYRHIGKAVGLFADITWQASSPFEADHIRQAMGGTASRVVIAPNLPPVATSAADERAPSTRAPGDPLRVSFISRILPNKNVDFALRVLRETSAPVVFDIFGPIEDATYWRACEELIAQLPANVTARYHGSIEHARVSEVLRDSDLFLLPTQRENFGHSILEALLAGTPVVIANTTPWRNLESAGVGWDLSLDDLRGFVAAVETASTMDETRYAQWRQHVRDYALRVSQNAEVLQANRRLFLDAASGAINKLSQTADSRR